MYEYFNDFQLFVLRLCLDHFRHSELLVRHDAVRRGVQNSPPPRDLWPNIVATIGVVEELRRRCGFAIRITSAYRSPAYNKAVGGAAGSQHLKFCALDIQPVSGRRDELRTMYKELRKMRDQEHWFKGGLGKYPTFVHVDTRGHNATW